jgi:hypothetical protein
MNIIRNGNGTGISQFGSDRRHLFGDHSPFDVDLIELAALGFAAIPLTGRVRKLQFGL